MSAETKNVAVTPTDAEVLVAKEKEIRKTYRRVIPGSIQRETEGAHAGKLTVEIRCATRGCKNTRRIATSDLFQVKYCVECTREMRNAKRRKPAKPAKAKASKTKASKTKATAELATA